MNKTCFMLVVLIVLLLPSQAFSQSPSEELPKFEVAAEFTTLERDAFFERRTEPGFGGRFTFNLNRVFSLETAGYFFPKECFGCEHPGHITEAVGGVKVGKRFNRWGMFAKARPGVVHFSSDFGGFVTCLSITCPFLTEPFRSDRTHFAADLGGVVEVYASKRIVTRFDAGDTIIHFQRQTANGLVFNPITNHLDPFLFVLPEKTSHNFQFMASVGFRF
jgi:hypothetical protein